MPTIKNGPNRITASTNFVKKRKTATTKKTTCNAKTLLRNTCTLVELTTNHLFRRSNK